jgi:hypothetical protein
LLSPIFCVQCVCPHYYILQQQTYRLDLYAYNASSVLTIPATTTLKQPFACQLAPIAWVEVSTTEIIYFFLSRCCCTASSFHQCLIHVALAIVMSLKRVFTWVALPNIRLDVKCRLVEGRLES